jgi:hypothetical protein
MSNSALGGGSRCRPHLHNHHSKDRDMGLTWELLLAVLGVLSACAMALVILWQ